MVLNHDEPFNQFSLGFIATFVTVFALKEL